MRSWGLVCSFIKKRGRRGRFPLYRKFFLNKTRVSGKPPTIHNEAVLIAAPHYTIPKRGQRWRPSAECFILMHARFMQRGKRTTFTNNRDPYPSEAVHFILPLHRVYMVVRQLRRAAQPIVAPDPPSSTVRRWSAVIGWRLDASSMCCHSRAAQAGDVEVEELLIGCRLMLHPGTAGRLSRVVAEWAR
jgi:hypothetical protein